MKYRISKIRKLLGNDYHLCTELSINGFEWTLYKNYLDTKIYYSSDNEAIMSSKTNSLDDLYKFAKDHHRINEIAVETYIYSIIATLLLIIQIINIAVIKNDYIKGLILGANYMIIISCLVKLVVLTINSKKEENEIKEQFKRNIERKYK